MTWMIDKRRHAEFVPLAGRCAARALALLSPPKHVQAGAAAAGRLPTCDRLLLPPSSLSLAPSSKDRSVHACLAYQRWAVIGPCTSANYCGWQRCAPPPPRRRCLAHAWRMPVTWVHNTINGAGLVILNRLSFLPAHRPPGYTGVSVDEPAWWCFWCEPKITLRYDHLRRVFAPLGITDIQ